MVDLEYRARDEGAKEGPEDVVTLVGLENRVPGYRDLFLGPDI